MDDVESLCIVKECREPEGRYSFYYTSRLLTIEPGESEESMSEIEKTIFKQDHFLQVKNVSQHHQHLCKIADSVRWRRLWDHSLEQGKTCVTSLVNLVRILTYPNHAAKKCPLCEDDELQFESLIYI